MSPRWFLAPLVVAVVLVGCLPTPGDEVTSIVLDGNRYFGGPANGFTIKPEDVAPAGHAVQIKAEVKGDAAFAISGVPASMAVVMESLDGGPRYWIFFREGILPPFSEHIDGLCRYVDPPPVEGC